MLFAAVTPLIAIAIGTVLALLGGAAPRVLSPVRSFALAAVLVAIATHILPDALAGGGPWTILVFAAGLVAPGAISRALRRGPAPDHGHGHGHGHGHHHDHGADHAALATTLGFVGILAHQVGDGLALGSFASPRHGGHLHWDVLVGIAAHTVPLAAVVALTGTRTVAIGRAALLAIATLAGLALATVGPELGEDVAPWLDAAVAGLLVHVLTHDLATPTRTSMTRTIELVAIAAGIALPLLAAQIGHGEHAAHGAEVDVGAALVTLVLELAPVLLVAIGLTAVLQIGRARWRRGHGGAGPALDLVAVLLTALLLGWPLAIGRVVATLVLAGALAWVLGARRSEAAPALGGVLGAIDAYLLRTSAWLVIGLVAATLVTTTWPPALALTTGAWPLDLLLAALVVVPAHVSAAAATPLAAAVIALGLPPSVAIAALVLGAATNRDVLGAAHARRGARGVVATLGLALAVAAALATALTFLVPLPTPAMVASPGLRLGSAIALILLLALTLWRHGLAAWLAPLHEEDQNGMSSSGLPPPPP